jgi:hypothetical protein
MIVSLNSCRKSAEARSRATRRTAITTAMVFVMVAIASVFFLVADQACVLVTLVLGVGG